MGHATPAPERVRNEQGEVQVEDRVSRFVTMYAVFCTADIPPEILDEFVEQSFQGHYGMVDDGDVGAFACVLETTDLDAVKYGSRDPMQAFSSPFIGFTDAQIRQWIKDHPHESFASGSYAIMDEDTIANRTLRVGCLLPNIRGKEDERALLTDFYGHMYLRVPLEMCTISWFEEDRVGTDKVYDEEYIQNGCRRSRVSRKTSSSYRCVRFSKRE